MNIYQNHLLFIFAFALILSVPLFFIHAQVGTLGVSDDDLVVICDDVSEDGSRCLVDGEDVGPTLSTLANDDLERLQEVMRNVQNVQIGADGIFSCNAGDQNMPVGTLTALNSPNNFVPVFDAAVTQNTGYLLYKECVLDGLVVQYRQTASAAIAEAMTTLISEGVGQGSFIQEDPALDRTRIANRVTAEMLKEYNTEFIHPDFRQEVYNTVANKYAQEVSGATRSYGYTKEDEDTISKFFDKTNTERGGFFQGLLSISRNFSNTPLGSALGYNSAIQAARTQAAADYQTQVNNGNGFKPIQERVEVDLGNGQTAEQYLTRTSGYTIAEMLSQALGTGFRQLENASEINEITGSAFLRLAGLQTQILASPSGVRGIVEDQPSGSGGGGGDSSSFFKDIIGALQDLFGNTIANSALAILTSALDTERDYRNAQANTVQYLAKRSEIAKEAEEKCWVDLRRAVRQSTGSTPINFATSTVFSDAALEPSINPLLQTARKARRIANSTIDSLGVLIDLVSNTNSKAVQQNAIAQVDALVATGSLHSQNDVANVKSNLANMKDVLGPSLSDTISAWATTTATTSVAFSATSTMGWCASTSPATVQYWSNQWQ